MNCGLIPAQIPAPGGPGLEWAHNSLSANWVKLPQLILEFQGQLPSFISSLSNN